MSACQRQMFVQREPFDQPVRESVFVGAIVEDGVVAVDRSVVIGADQDHVLQFILAARESQ